MEQGRRGQESVVDSRAQNLRLGDAVWHKTTGKVVHVVSLARLASGEVSIIWDDGSVEAVDGLRPVHVLDNERVI